MGAFEAATGAKALVCGSMAYDFLLNFPDQFRKHILADQLHILNVSFTVPTMSRHFGGCAGNVAYNLKLLGSSGVPMATVGIDFDPYAAWFDACGISQRHIRRIDHQHTAQAFITTDIDGNQIAAFHPGAMNYAQLNSVLEAEDIEIGLIAPDGRVAMIEHATQLAYAAIPFIFDPGQSLPLFSAEEIRQFIEFSDWVVVNEYEWQLLQRKTGWTVHDITSRVEALIVTHGANGSEIHLADGLIVIPPAPVRAAVDPTGCGDAYRAGLIHGLLESHDWEVTGRIASLAGAIKVESRGSQNHRYTRDEFAARFGDAFGTPLPMPAATPVLGDVVSH